MTLAFGVLAQPTEETPSLVGLDFFISRSYISIYTLSIYIDMCKYYIYIYVCKKYIDIEEGLDDSRSI